MRRYIGELDYVSTSTSFSVFRKLICVYNHKKWDLSIGESPIFEGKISDFSLQRVLVCYLSLRISGENQYIVVWLNCVKVEDSCHLLNLNPAKILRMFDIVASSISGFQYSRRIAEVQSFFLKWPTAICGHIKEKAGAPPISTPAFLFWISTYCVCQQ